MIAHQLPPGWEWKRLGDICILINGDAYKDTDWSSKGVPIIRIQNLNDKTKPFNY
jgi:restriction endonuclease S subunit